ATQPRADPRRKRLGGERPREDERAVRRDAHARRRGPARRAELVRREVPGAADGAAEADLRRHRDCVPREHPTVLRRVYPARRAISSMSTGAPSGTPATATVVRAVYGAVKRCWYAAFIAPKSFISVR